MCMHLNMLKAHHTLLAGDSREILSVAASNIKAVDEYCV
jgi:hypothetical protein